jgi:hypothetical protein
LTAGFDGHRHDYRDVVPLLADAADVIVPNLRCLSLTPTSIGSTTPANAPRATLRDVSFFCLIGCG